MASLQPRKKKRKYTNWDTQANMGLPSFRRPSRRISNASNKNDAILSNATVDVPLPACTSSRQSQTPINSSSLQSGDCSMLAKKNDAVSSNATLDVPLPACTSSQQSQTPINSLSYLHSGDCSMLAKTNDANSSNATLRVPLLACTSSQQSQTTTNSSAYLHCGDRSMLATSMLAKKNDEISSNATLHACTSSQQSQTSVNSSSYLHSSDCSMLTTSMLAKKNDAISSSATLRVPLPACTSSQQSQTPIKSPPGNCSMLTKSMLAKKNDAISSDATLDVPLPCTSSQQSPIKSPSYLHSGKCSMLTASMLSKKKDAISSKATLDVPLPACTSSQQSQTPINSPSYLRSGDCNYVCEYCGSYFWHGERVKSFSTNRQPKYIRCCKGATSDTLAEASCSGSTQKPQRLCSEQGSGESVQQTGTKDKIESGSSELADEGSTEIRNYILPYYVNKLLDRWNRGQNAVFFDGQDRLVKVVGFVSSLLDNVKKPILIIASSSALSLWEIEFSEWSKSINVVTYKGTKDILAAIRGSEFQVLLSSPDAIVEDMETLDHIKWELLVIDACQCPEISMHLKKIEMLKADMKLLTVSGEPVDILQNYHNILSLVDCKNEKIHTDADMETNDDISILKERLWPFIAFDCKFSTPDLEEYWVPVHLSSMQIEQYCSILVSNSDALYSSSRTSSLYDVVTQIQKCCDHPYLMDPTLRNSTKKPFLIDPAAEINVSGKLHVFYKLLLQIKRCGLRALVLFHSAVNSEKISTGHLLEDLVNKKFGENSYVYIPGWILSHSAYVKKKESVEMFNKAESDRFICLCDHLACLSSLRLSRVDVVILFNSDRNPSNDIKALKRITIDSHCERLERLYVFRLYSTLTVEEKALILLKQGITVDSYISRSDGYQLLTWGATYLFSKLQSRTDSGPQLFIDDLVHELSSLLRNMNVRTCPTKRSIISRAHMQNGAYSRSISLFGETETHTKESLSLDEYLIGRKHHAFWSNSVKQSQAVPEKSCSSSLTYEKQSGTKDKIESGSSELADEVSTETHNHILPYVTKLLGHWNRGQNAVFFDGQERLAKVASFVSSLLDITKKPILIIASSSALLLWEVEFIKWSKSVNVVTYRGTKDIRAAVRGSEFQVLLSSIDAIVEDVKTLDHIKWELLVIDECQLPVISMQLKNIQMLTADMKLLTVSGEPVDILQSYQNILSLVDCKNEKMHTDADMEMNHDISILKERLSPFIAFKCDLKRTQKETTSVKVLQIPASELARSTNSCLTSGPTTYLPGPSLAQSGQRRPAPHLRSNTSLFASFSNQPATGDPSPKPFLSLSPNQTVNK